VLAPEDDPTQGMAVISGNASGGLLSASHTWSVNLTRQKPHQEAVRQFDKERVYQVDSKGVTNKNTYVDVERLKRVRLNTDLGPLKVLYANPPKVDNVETLKTDETRSSSEGGS
jgi:hypothetical protein